MKLEELFLNKGLENQTVVEAPAFSITKVMALVAPLVTAVVTFATSQLSTVTFTGGQITAMIASLIGFLAITGAADVLARGLATSAQEAASGRGRWIRFEKPLNGTLTMPGTDESVSILAASDAEPTEFLCVREDKTLSWEPASEIKLT